MVRFSKVFIFVLISLLLAGRSLAQTDLRSLSGMEPVQYLDWRNPELYFDFTIPAGAKDASLTIFAEPMQILPAKNSLIVVRVNNNPGIAVNPKPEAFSAHISLPASHLKAGRNRVRILFEGAAGGLCPVEGDGGWRFDLSQGRFDLSITKQIKSFQALEGWMAKGPWAIDKISVTQGALSNDVYAAMGALIVQGIGIRGERIPHIVPAGGAEGVSFTGRIDPALVGPSLALRPGERPVVEFLGRNEKEVLAAARLFAGRKIMVDGTRAAPVMLARAPRVEAGKVFDGVKDAMTQAAWYDRPQLKTVRIAKNVQSRLVVEFERPDWVSTDSVAVITANGREQRKRLGKKLNRIVVPLNTKTPTVEHAFSIARETRPAKHAASQCASGQPMPPMKLVSAQIQSTGFAHVKGLGRIAIDGAPFTEGRGHGTAIVFGAKTPAELHAGWRAAARIALIGGQPLTAAWYGADVKKVPATTIASMVIGPRSQLTTAITATLPPAFGSGVAPGPRKTRTRRKDNIITRSYTAYADADMPTGLGVAGWALIDGRQTLILTGDVETDFIPSMQSFADGQALNFFGGVVARWQAGLVEINDAGQHQQTTGGNGPSGNALMAVLFVIAGICLAGLWVLYWRRAFENWQPDIDVLDKHAK